MPDEMSYSRAEVMSIVVTFNGEQWVRRCLSSLENAGIDNRIVVIDNHSEDNTVRIIQKEFPSVKLITLSRNEGFGKANNIGLKLFLNSPCAFALLLNQDAWVEPSTICGLISVFERRNDFGILSPLHLKPSGNELDYQFKKFCGPRFCEDLLSDSVLQKELKEVYETNFVNAACWLLPRITVETIGGFDPLFFHYGEDNNYCQRALFHGFKIGIVPGKKAYHDSEREKTVKTNRKADLVKYANVNIDGPGALKQDIQNKLTGFFLRFITLRSSASYYWKDYVELRKLRKKIATSWVQNKVKHPNYIN